jgi:ribosomal protein S4
LFIEVEVSLERFLAQEASFLLVCFVSSGNVVRIPSREEMEPIINEELIVELYSR